MGNTLPQLTGGAERFTIDIRQIVPGRVCSPLAPARMFFSEQPRNKEEII